MRNKIVGILALMLALTGLVGGVAAQPQGTWTKPNGVTVIAGESLASAGAPAAAVAYTAAQSK